MQLLGSPTLNRPVNFCPTISGPFPPWVHSMQVWLVRLALLPLANSILWVIVANLGCSICIRLRLQRRALRHPGQPSPVMEFLEAIWSCCLKCPMINLQNLECQWNLYRFIGFKRILYDFVLCFWHSMTSGCDCSLIQVTWALWHSNWSQWILGLRCIYIYTCNI